MVKGLECTLLQKNYTNGQEAHEKMLIIINHQEKEMTMVAVIKTQKQRHKCWWGCREMGTPVYCG